MNEVFELVKDQLLKMEKDKSWIVGALGSAAVAIPKWVTSKEVTLEHGVLIAILLAMFLLDYAAGSRLAKKSPVKKKESNVIIDCLIRDFVILIICVVGYGFDYLLGTGAIIFTAFTVAFIYQNLYSFLANINVLGWGDWFPMWLFSWLQDEIEAKKEKYFPARKGDKNEY